jgi:hypothetical protein
MLADLQTRLERHFQSLQAERRGLAYPVYALEHGLDASEVVALRETLSADLLTVGFLRKQHWLLWTVVAAEVGYSYDGEEFWQSFAGQIPSWRRFGNRDTIRTWFKRFAKTYSGFVPQGRWARHFGIIAWPISHSILPRDLQTHFARLLYDMRFDLARQVNLGVEKVEELLAGRDATGSSRFNDLLEQTQLLARVVLALRDEDVQGAVQPIYLPTLARLVSDIGAKRAAREWLKEARRIIRNARFDATALAGKRHDLRRRLTRMPFKVDFFDDGIPDERRYRCIRLTQINLNFAGIAIFPNQNARIAFLIVKSSLRKSSN